MATTIGKLRAMLTGDSAGFSSSMDKAGVALEVVHDDRGRRAVRVIRATWPRVVELAAEASKRLGED